MTTLATIVSSILKNGLRILKVMQFGAKTAEECAPFGEDSSPLPGMVAVYADTAEMGEPVIIGYINENQLAKVGEKRIYSLKQDGSLSFYLWLKNNGTVELGGTDDNLVRYAPLNAELQSFAEKLNTELGKISGAITALGGAYVPTSATINISESKIDQIKCL